MATRYTAEITDPLTGQIVTACAETPEDLEVAIDRYLAVSYPEVDVVNEGTLSVATSPRQDAGGFTTVRPTAEAGCDDRPRP